MPARSLPSLELSVTTHGFVRDGLPWLDNCRGLHTKRWWERENDKPTSKAFAWLCRSERIGSIMLSYTGKTFKWFWLSNLDSQVSVSRRTGIARFIWLRLIIFQSVITSVTFFLILFNYIWVQIVRVQCFLIANSIGRTIECTSVYLRRCAPI